MVLSGGSTFLFHYQTKPLGQKQVMKELSSKNQERLVLREVC